MNKVKKIINNFPSRIRILRDVDYEMVFIDNFEDGKTLGECRPEPKQIVIKKNESTTLTARTILHEIIHAIDMENNIGLTETQVLGLEEGIFRALKLNGLL